MHACAAVDPQAEVGGPLGAAVETELEFIRAEGCDEGFSGEVITSSLYPFHIYIFLCRTFS